MMTYQSAWETPFAKALRVATRTPTVSRFSLREIALLVTLDEMRAAGWTDPVSVKELAQTLGVGKPSITRALNRLATLNYTIRHKHPTDGRKVSVTLTEQGAEVLAHMAAVQRSPALAA